MSASLEASPVQADSVYLLASITKPVTACALMLLVERGDVSLTDPASRYLPEFSGGERDKVLVRDLLTHTSGLPDMLPENTDLRRAHAPLSEFVERTYRTPLLYPPGTSFRYQSMGVLLAGAIVEKITGMRLRDFVNEQIFDPLEMRNSTLGLGSLPIGQTVQAWTSPDASASDTERFGPNSPLCSAKISSLRNTKHPKSFVNCSRTGAQVSESCFCGPALLWTKLGARISSLSSNRSSFRRLRGHVSFSTPSPAVIR
jgi:CubicO group peptidase (beta-lactamase class C family)